MKLETRERINNGIIELLAKGEWPTTVKVLALIGRGSKRDISEAMAEFARERLPEVAAFLKGEILSFNTDDDRNTKELDITKAQLEECRENLKLAYERFEAMEIWMYGRIDQAREEKQIAINKLKEEFKKEREINQLEHRALLIKEREYAQKIDQLMEEMQGK